MKEFIIRYFREILLVILVVVVTFLLIKIFTPAPDKSELLIYKLEQLDKKIQETEKKQIELDKNIQTYKEDIKRIDENIIDIRNQKSVINNYYENKQKEIPGYTNKQIDSVLRKRYKY
jgi:septal ring factor EnvC (AmiA/AmiB activator)